MMSGRVDAKMAMEDIGSYDFYASLGVLLVD